MRPEEVPPGPVLVDTDVLSWIALGEGRGEEFAALLVGHELFTSFITVAEVPIVTANLRDFSVLAAASELKVIHPDLAVG